MQVRVNRKSNSEFYGPPINQRVLEMLSVQSVLTRRAVPCVWFCFQHFTSEYLEDYVSLTFINTYLIPGVGWMSEVCKGVPALSCRTRATQALSYNENI